MEVCMEAADPVEEQESVVEAGQGDQQEIEGVPHVCKKEEKKCIREGQQQHINSNHIFQND